MYLIIQLKCFVAYSNEVDYFTFVNRIKDKIHWETFI